MPSKDSSCHNIGIAVARKLFPWRSAKARRPVANGRGFNPCRGQLIFAFFVSRK